MPVSHSGKRDEGKRKNIQSLAMCAICTLDQRPSIFIRDKPIFSSERVSMTARVQLEKKMSLVVSHKGFDTKMN
jgi:hypothetical protein